MVGTQQSVRTDSSTERELDRLAALHESADPELAVVYGRRQVEKSELVFESIRNRSDAVVSGDQGNARDTAHTVHRSRRRGVSWNHYDRVEWEPLLSYLAAENAIVVIDEFPYPVAADESLPAAIQHL